jgi:hypothetical protein
MIRKSLAVGAVTLAAALTFTACAKEPEAESTTTAAADVTAPPVTVPGGAIDEDLNVCDALTLDQVASVVGENADTEAPDESTTTSSCTWVSTSGPERSLELTVSGPEGFVAAKQQYAGGQATADSPTEFVTTQGSTVVAAGLTEDGRRTFVLVLTGGSESEIEALATLLSEAQQALNDTTADEPETPQDPEQIDGTSSDAEGG